MFSTFPDSGADNATVNLDVNAVCNLLVNTGDNLSGPLLTFCFGDDSNDRLCVGSSHQEPTIRQCHLNTVAGIQWKVTELFPKHSKHCGNPVRRTGHFFFYDTVPR